MKWFWGIIAVLVVLAAALLLFPRPGPVQVQSAPGHERSPAGKTGEENAAGVEQGAGAEPGTASGPAVDSASAAPVSALSNQKVQAEPLAHSTTTPAEQKAPTLTTTTTGQEDAEKQATAAQHAAAAREMTDALDDLLGTDGWRTPTRSKSPYTTSGMTSTAPARAGSASETAAPPADAPIKLAPQPDGSVLVDDVYKLTGKGTRDEPYKVAWEMLVSAEKTYQPRLGRKIIPERLKMLDGKWVTISGYIAFPIMSQSADEMLMMLNQWDGCCIGVPPTPYDAIEVKLKEAPKGDEKLRTSGTITGVLRVDPFLVKDWLVSLYLMDEGVLEKKDAKK